MPTLQCPNCGQTVRFEGVAGICPSCASVVMVPKDFSEVKPPPPVPKSGRPSLESLGDLAGGEPTIFEPAPIDEPRKIAGMDPGVVITLCAVAVVLVAFGVYVIVHSMGGSAGQTKVVAAPAPPPSLLNLPEAPAVAPPPPAPSPPTSAPAAAAPPPPPPPAWTLLRPVRPPPSDASVLTDAKVSQAIERAVDFYLKELDDEKRFVTDRSHGIFVLCAYALLHAGQSIDDPRLGAGSPKMQHVLELMKKIEFFDFQTYSHSLRAAALALLNRPADRETLTADLQWLLKASHKGSYSYDIGPTTAYDNSNSQYGMLGVWAASDAGFSVPTTYWNEVEQHWLSCQREEGAWEYIPTAGASLTMTAAGVTSLTVASEQRGLVSSIRDRDADPAVTRAIARGVAWMDEGDHAVDLRFNHGYALYGMERAALATGYKYFGQHNWYRELAGTELRSQSPDGSWGENDVETAFRVLFLSRGRQPLLMNKLRFDGPWNSRPRDLSKLSQFCSSRLERTFAWGVVDLDRNWWDWLDAPVLMLSTDTPPPMTDELAQKFRQYTDSGGLLFIHNEFATQEMDEFVADLVHRAYPEYRLHAPAADDLLFSAAGKLSKPPPLKVIANADRTLLVYSPTDITRQWVQRRAKQIDPASEFGLNLFVYAAGTEGFHHRLDNDYLPPSVVPPLSAMPVARLQYPGQWDPEPSAWTRFARFFQDQTSEAVDVRPMPMTSLDPKVTPFATITGATAADFDKLDLKPLRKYVDDGGVLFIDACGGSPAFATSVRDKLLPTAFADVQFESLDPTSPVLAGAGDCMDPLPKPQVRQSAIIRLGGVPAQVDAAVVGKGMVFVSDLDVTAGLLNAHALSIVGYTPEYSQSLMKNVMLWTVNRLHPRP